MIQSHPQVQVPNQKFESFTLPTLTGVPSNALPMPVLYHNRTFVKKHELRTGATLQWRESGIERAKLVDKNCYKVEKSMRTVHIFNHNRQRRWGRFSRDISEPDQFCSPLGVRLCAVPYPSILFLGLCPQRWGIWAYMRSGSTNYLHEKTLGWIFHRNEMSVFFFQIMKYKHPHRW